MTIPAVLLLVNLVSGTFSWDYPADAPALTGFQFTCNGAPAGPPVAPGARTVAVSAIVSAPGEYTCAIAAVNEFGTSEPSNAVAFKAGLAPASPSGLRIVIQ